ncbi:MAG: hypothetical protein KA105_05945 [Caulobacter sp.]|nr:hypothetical protein [Caulobacter sp.]
MKKANSATACVVALSMALGGCAHVETAAERDAVALSMRPEAEKALATLGPECTFVVIDGMEAGEITARVGSDDPKVVYARMGSLYGPSREVSWPQALAQYDALVEARVLRRSPRSTDTQLWFQVTDEAVRQGRNGFCYGKRTLTGPLLLSEAIRGECYFTRVADVTYVFSDVPDWARDPRVVAVTPKALRTEGEVIKTILPLISGDGRHWQVNHSDPVHGGMIICP